tara:strand:+ start:218 stop:604 length:387 start_codon:yes stop_codon:yes gene_type:complete
MSSIKYMSKKHKTPYLYNSDTKKSNWIMSNDNDKWSRYSSAKNKGKYYWHNSETKETIWETSKFNNDLKKEKPIITKNSIYNTSNHEDEFTEYAICNGNGMSTTIRAIDKYDAMEQMRDIAQSLNPYD